MTRDQQRQAAAATLRKWLDQVNGGPVVANFTNWPEAFGAYQAALHDTWILSEGEDIQALFEQPVVCARCGHAEAEHSIHDRRPCLHKSGLLDVICWCQSFKEQAR